MKNCPRCGSSFECRPENIDQCQCREVQLSAPTLAYLAQTEYDCLCKKCLEELNRLVALAQRHQFPKPGEPMVEGLHYYTENGMWVFTEFYHLMRGYCCKSGCRHCAYGYGMKDN